MSEITGYGNMQISYGGVDIPIKTMEYQIKDYKKESLKFEFDNQNNIQYLYKKGNRWIRKIRVYQIAQTDAEFKALATALYAMSGMPVQVTPHIDEPSKTQLSWLVAFWDRYNEYPVEFIEIELTGVDIE